MAPRHKKKYMKLFDVYPINDITIVKAKGSYVWDQEGQQYLDLYGGHAVISIGHTHPHYVTRISDQLNKVAFYSNSIHNPCLESVTLKVISNLDVTPPKFSISRSMPFK